MKVDLFSDVSGDFYPDGIFHPELIKKAAELTGHKARFFEARTDKVNVLFYSFAKNNKMVPVPSLPYSCIVKVEKKNEGKSLERHMLSIAEEISKILPKNAVILVSPENADVRPFIWCGFKAEVLYTYAAVPGWDESGIDREERKQIKKAESRKLIVGECSDFNALSDMLFKSYSRHKRKPPYEKKYILGMIEKADELNILKIRAALDADGFPVAFRATIAGDKTSFDWIAGSTEKGNTDGANSLLLQRSISEETGRGKFFDLCGANTRSISFFKAGFGLKLLRYARLCR